MQIGQRLVRMGKNKHPNLMAQIGQDVAGEGEKAGTASWQLLVGNAPKNQRALPAATL